MIDAQLIFDGALVAGGAPTGTAITVTRVSTNVLDMLTARDMGVGSGQLGIHIDVVTAFTAGGAATMQIDVEVGATAGGTYYALSLSPIIPVAQLIAGAPVFRQDMPINQILNAAAGVLNAPGRFIRLAYTIATGPMTAGAVFAYLNPYMDRGQYYTYPNNYTV